MFIHSRLRSGIGRKQLWHKVPIHFYQNRMVLRMKLLHSKKLLSTTTVKRSWKELEEQKQEINAIIRNRAVPDFENTIVALDRSGELLTKVEYVFGPIASSNSTEETRALEKELSPLFSAHSDDIYLNPLLFCKKWKEVYDNQKKIWIR